MPGATTPLKTDAPVASAPVAATGGERKGLPALTGVRFLAAFWVVLYHYDREILANVPTALKGLGQSFLEAGATGVSLFYILSGFILAHTYWTRDVVTKGGLRDFWVHRFARLYPMYAVAILLLLPRLLIDRNDPSIQYAYDHPWYVGFSHLFLIHNWTFHPINVFNGPTWSVGCEAGFYLLFPSLLPLVRRVSARGALVAIGIIFLASAVLPLMYANDVFPRIYEALGRPYDRPIDGRINQSIRMWPIFRLGEFAIGMLLAALLRVHREWTSGQRRILSGTIVAGAFLFAGSIWTATPVMALVVQQVTPVPCFAAAILALALHQGARPGWLAAPSLVLLGEASYSLYLLHVPMKHALRLVGTRAHLPMLGLPMIAVSLLLTIAVSIVAFRHLESPMRRWIVARYAPRKA